MKACNIMKKAAMRHVCVIPQGTAHVNYGDIARLVAGARYPRQPHEDDAQAGNETKSLVAARDAFREKIDGNWLPRALREGLITPLDSKFDPRPPRPGGPAADDGIALDEFVAFAAAHGVIVGTEGATAPHPYLPGSLEQVDHMEAWWDAQVGAWVLWEAEAVTAQQAAMALCGFSPFAAKPEEVEQVIWHNETSPEDYKRLLFVFEATERDEPKVRTLADWLSIARAKVVRYHSWIDAWLTATGKYASTVLPSSDTPAQARQPSVKATNSGDWKDEVRKIADELDGNDQMAGAWSSTTDISERIAALAIQRGIRGPHGQLTSANILREALQGGRWQRARKGPAR